MGRKLVGARPHRRHGRWLQRARFSDRPRAGPDRTVLEFHGTKDEETGYGTCRRLVERSRSMGGDIELVTYQDATHDFDDPGTRRQRVPANQHARADAIQRSEALFERILARG